MYVNVHAESGMYNIKSDYGLLTAEVGRQAALKLGNIIVQSRSVADIDSSILKLHSIYNVLCDSYREKSNRLYREREKTRIRLTTDS